MLFSGCSTSSPKQLVSIDTRATVDRVPPSLLTPCAKRRTGSKTIGAIVARARWAETKLAECAAQVDGVREWDAGRVSDRP